MKKSPILLIISFIVLCSGTVYSQKNKDPQLAQQYFNNGEYEKAAQIYTKMFNKDPYGVYPSLLKCYKSLEDYDSAEKLVKKVIKKRSNHPDYLIDLGQLYELMDQVELANKQYEKTLKSLGPQAQQILRIGRKFVEIQELDFAEQTYLKGRTLLADYPFHFELAEVYAQKKESTKMIEEYLDVVNFRSNYLKNLKTILQNKLSNDLSGTLSDELRMALLRRIQNDPDQTIYSELLYWLFVQEKDFESAFIQAKALDKRSANDGSRVMRLASLCSSNKQYDLAESCYQYVIELSSDHPNYMRARIEQINTINEKVTEGNNYTQSDLTNLESKYQQTLSDLGKNAATADLLRGYARLKAFYLNKIDESIALLEEAIRINNVTPNFKANCKLDLGDILILKGEVWDATLYYAQVDKEFKLDALGREAKYRKARLSYYLGEFEWAAAQLNVLKAATSQLISNDALSLALLIQDNLGLDTSTAALLMYARADLLSFQNHHKDAHRKLDSLLLMFPGHALTDEVWLKKAKIHIEDREYQDAAIYLQDILDNYPSDITADDALFKLAELNETELDNKETAMDLYGKMLTDYPGSLYTVEARKRFRTLRGDKIN